MIFKKLSFFLLLLLSCQVFGSESESLYYISGPHCQLKQYVNKSLEQVPDENFVNKSLNVFRLKKNSDFSVFKINGDTFMAPTICFVQNAKKTSYTPTVNSKKNGTFFFEIRGGKGIFQSKENIFPNYQSDFSALMGQTNSSGVRITDVTSGDSTNYKSKILFSVGAGYKVKNYSFGFRIKKISASKAENIVLGVTDLNTGNSDTILHEFEFKDSMTDYMVGMNYSFLNSMKFRPYLSLYAGLSNLNSVYNYVDTSNSELNPKTYQFHSLGFVTNLESGFEFYIMQNIALTAAGGYEIKFHKDLKNEDSSSSAKGFTTAFNYSNFYGVLGFVFYWQ